MKLKLNTFIGSILLGAITAYSGIHPERYHISITIMFGTLACLSIALLLTLDQTED